MKKKPLTLIEMLISLALVAVLLTAALGLYAQSVYLQQQAASARKENFDALYLQSRLASLLTQLTIKRDQNTYWFYTDARYRSPHLIFTYDNGMDIDPLFGDLLIGELFIDEHNSLSLLSWPDPYRIKEPTAPIRREVLLENVQAIDFSFYRPPRSDPKEWEIDMTNQTAFAQWTNVWLSNDDSLPALIQVSVTRKDQKPWVFSFAIPSKNPILYHSP